MNSQPKLNHMGLKRLSLRKKKKDLLHMSENSAIQRENYLKRRPAEEIIGLPQVGFKQT